MTPKDIAAGTDGTDVGADKTGTAIAATPTNKSEPAATQKINLLDFDLDSLREFFASIGEKPFRATQLINWVHQRGVADLAEMTNLSKSLRAKLQDMAEVKTPAVVFDKESADGTRKWLLALDRAAGEKNIIEMVFIPENGRGTLCISSQVGCSLDCSFCSTARQGFNSNLSCGEIIGQIWLARKLLLAQQAERYGANAENNGRVITNVVLMGMGEPLLNYDNVVQACKLMLDDHAYGLSKRRVTLSTSGVVPAMYRLIDDVDVALAVSLHAPNDTLRNGLVPVNKRFPLKELLAACRHYIQSAEHKRHVTFEYVMLDGVNDKPEHARELAKLLRGIPCKINLIPFNPFNESGYNCSSKTKVQAFSEYLQGQGYVATVRKTRGDDIDAACGQLVGKVNDRSRRHLRFVEPRLGAESK